MLDKYIHSHLNSATSIIHEYMEKHAVDGQPLHFFLKNYFKKNPKYGKRDRQSISDFVYAYFKMGHAVDKHKIKERIKYSCYLSSQHQDDFFGKAAMLLGINHEQHADFKIRLKKIQSSSSDFNVNTFIPFFVDFSNGISLSDYFESFFTPGYFYLRTKKNYLPIVVEELKNAQLPFTILAGFDNCIRIEKQSQLQQLNSWKKGYFDFQDISSQSISQFFHPNKNELWWDMCAASGGKSLLLLNKESDIKLLCSDVRNSILINLKERFNRFGFKADVQLFDLTKPVQLPYNFNGIICDAPCSGSGTWKRSPDELFFFTREKLNNYVTTQRKILENAYANFSEQTQLYYSTCSVFAVENELQNTNTNNYSIQHHLLNYLKDGGNCMFASVIK